MGTMKLIRVPTVLLDIELFSGVFVDGSVGAFGGAFVGTVGASDGVFGGTFVGLGSDEVIDAVIDTL